MKLDAVIARLRSRIGLEPGSIGQGSFEEVLRLRARALGLPDVEAYAGRLLHDEDELQCLIARLLVHETWFFRYPASFHHLEEVAAEYAANALDRPFRVLSAACATGEEPASIAITLLEAGLPPHLIDVQACDLSRLALERARAGRFSGMSFRGRDPSTLLRWLEPDGDTWRLRLPVQRLIRYFPANLLDPGLPATTSFDAIFCRNLLIYLTERARERVLSTLRSVLAPRGLLYLGHAELGRVQRYGFEAERPVAAFACRPAGARTRGPAASAVVAERASVTRSRPAPVVPADSTPRASGPADSPAAPRPSPPPRDADSTVETLARASALADRGQHDAARRILENAAEVGRATADHFHLLAVIHSALRNEDAERHALRRALYLDRDHYPSLVQAALRADADGAPEKARRFRERAARAHAAHEQRRSDARRGRTA